MPHVLILFRFIAGGAVLGLATLYGRDGRYGCAAILALGVLSDIFDGVIARRIGVATPALRKLDSRADVAFWLSMLLSILIIYPELRPSLGPMAVILIGIEFAAPIISLVRFGQEACTHHILSKLFGLGLWMLMTVLFLRGSAIWLQFGVFALGVASQVEAIAIMLVLPTWRTDVRGLAHALRLRRELSPRACRARMRTRRGPADRAAGGLADGRDSPDLDAMAGEPDDPRDQRLAQALRANLRRRKAGRAVSGPDGEAPPIPAASCREALDGASGAERLSSDTPAEPSSADPFPERSS